MIGTKSRFNREKNWVRMREQSLAQESSGPRLYISKLKATNYQRVDLVIGDAGVPISALIRNVYDLQNERLIGDKTVGTPSKVVSALNLTIEDHGKEFSQSSGISLIDTRSRFSGKILRQRRILNRRPLGLGEMPFLDYEWNFTLDMVTNC